MTADEALNALESGTRLTQAQAMRLADVACRRAQHAIDLALARGGVPIASLLDAIEERGLHHDERARLARILDHPTKEGARVDLVEVLGHIRAGDVPFAIILIERDLSEAARHDGARQGRLFKRLAEARTATSHTEAAP